MAEQLGQLGSAVRAARAEAERLDRSLAAATAARDADAAAMAELEARLAAAAEAPAEAEPTTDERDRLAAAATAARQAEVEARLALRTCEERGRALAGRAEQLERAAVQERVARERFARRREQAAAELVVAGAVRDAVGVVLERLAQSLADAGAERAAAEHVRAEREAELVSVRARGRELEGELDQLTDSVHRDEVARTEQRLRIEQLEQRALEEYGVDTEALLAEYGPDQLVPPSPAAPGDVVDEGAPEPQPVRTCGRSRRSGPAPPTASSRCSAGSTRWRSRSSPRWRSARSSSASSSRTSRRPAATCSTSSARWTSGSSRSSPRPTATSSASSTTSSRGCSPAARAG